RTFCITAPFEVGDAGIESLSQPFELQRVLGAASRIASLASPYSPFSSRRSMKASCSAVRILRVALVRSRGFQQRWGVGKDCQPSALASFLLKQDQENFSIVGLESFIRNPHLSPDTRPRKDHGSSTHDPNHPFPARGAAAARGGGAAW